MSFFSRLSLVVLVLRAGWAILTNCVLLRFYTVNTYILQLKKEHLQEYYENFTKLLKYSTSKIIYKNYDYFENKYSNILIGCLRCQINKLTSCSTRVKDQSESTIH